ncbi:putative bifunctional diguanylate cyclase/phosphodiesterase [Allostreptomyces psammosilenae]|uniref:Diguanylate cyclase (GGDEF)-like protein/PAS domain S-box-containing protein n=1 Tax=Allostreptomyces psammosilenae TaxID=1892865 RepID=A0A852ZZA3_9ACTN|nr:diguanylate cyclase [Allostreptomyces psammosilenae]NYI06550.1 diguanylate cyclase (GGDEF)-like protein/PAS domain S-box-containing protein [Allostreptomyces psammosilenae]
MRQLLCMPVPLAAAICLMYTAGAAWGWGNERLALIMGDFGLGAAGLVAALACLRHALLRSRGRERAAWLLFTVSAFAMAMGNCLWGWYELIEGVAVPTPSLADVCFLLFAPAAMVGLAMLAQRPRGAVDWLCLVLDACLVGGSLFVMIWNLALSRSGGEDEPLRTVLVLAYPVLDILLISLLVGLRLRVPGDGGGGRRALHAALAALTLTVVCDALWASPDIRDTYRSGGLLDAGWFVAFMLLACAPCIGGQRDAAHSRRGTRPADAATGAPAATAEPSPTAPEHAGSAPGEPAPADGEPGGTEPAETPTTATATTAPSAAEAVLAAAAGAGAGAATGEAGDGGDDPAGGAEAPVSVCPSTLLRTVHPEAFDEQGRPTLPAPVPTVCPSTLLRTVHPEAFDDSGPGSIPAPRSASTTAMPRASTRLSVVTPYIAAVVCMLGVLWDALSSREQDPVVAACGATVIFVLVARQGILLIDNMTLARDLAAQEGHYRSLVQDSSDVLMIAGPDGRLRHVSHASLHVLHTPAEQLVGTTLDDLVHTEDRGHVLFEIRRFLAREAAGAPASRIEFRARSGAGAGQWLHAEAAISHHREGLLLNVRDVSERVRLQQQLQHNAFHDPLTDLPNRALFVKRVQQALGGRRSQDSSVAVLFVDLDGFKQVNDTAGHQAGDTLLVRAARRLESSVRTGDTVARLGGDEFAALICGVEHSHLLEIAERLLTALSEPYSADGIEIPVAASIGIAHALPGETPDELMRNADLAMYRAKAQGKGRVVLYAPHMHADAVRRLELESSLRRAINGGDFTVLYQPVADLIDGRVVAMEAQVRWRTAGGGPLPDEEFLRRAEQGGRALPLARWQVERALEQAVRWYQQGYRVPVLVPLSAARLGAPGVSEAVAAALTRTRLPGRMLTLQLQEGPELGRVDELRRLLAAFARLDVGFALSGLGTGSVPLSLLHQLPVDVLRLDRSLTATLGGGARRRSVAPATAPAGGVEEPLGPGTGRVPGPAAAPAEEWEWDGSGRAAAVAGSLIGLGRELNLTVVADGIEYADQIAAARALGCTAGQGPLVAGPVEAGDVLGLLARGAVTVGADRGALDAAGLPGFRREEGGSVTASAETTR